MPTQLPVRAPAQREPATNAPAWIAGILALAVLIALTVRAPVPCDIAPDSADVGTPHQMMRIVLAHAAPAAGMP